RSPAGSDPTATSRHMRTGRQWRPVPFVSYPWSRQPRGPAAHSRSPLHPYEEMNNPAPERPAPSALALTPLLLFLLLFFGAGLYFAGRGEAMGFYQLSAPVAVLPALALGAWLLWRRGRHPLDTLLEGMGQPNVMLMVLVFLLAGAF